MNLKSTKVFIYSIWFFELLIISRFTVFVRQREGEHFASVDTHAIADIFFVMVLTGLLLVSLNKSLVKSIRTTSLFWLLAYYLLSCISAVWSIMPEYSLFRAIQFTIPMLGVYVAIFKMHNFKGTEKYILIISLIVLFLSLTPQVLARRFTLDGMHAAEYPAIAAMIFGYCFGELISTRRLVRYKWKLLHFSCLCISLCCVVIGTSSATNLSVGCGIIFSSVIARNKKVLFFSIGIVSFIFLLFGDWNWLVNSLFPGKSNAQILSAHGRVDLWKLYWYLFVNDPIVGIGFSIGARIASIYTTSTHNFIFSILLGTGIVGAIIFSLFLLNLIRECFFSIKKRYFGSVGCSTAFFIGFINSLSYPIIGDQWFPPSMVFICFLSLFLIHVKSGHAYSSAHYHHLNRYEKEYIMRT